MKLFKKVSNAADYAAIIGLILCGIGAFIFVSLSVLSVLNEYELIK